jgi:hypothetical protein
MMKIRVMLPFHLQTLAQVEPEVTIDVAAPVTRQSLVAALEKRYPTLRSAIIDPHTGKRRPLLRFFACQQDLTFQSPDAPLPDAVLEGREAFMVVGAISGG